MPHFFTQFDAKLYVKIAGTQKCMDEQTLVTHRNKNKMLQVQNEAFAQRMIIRCRFSINTHTFSELTFIIHNTKVIGET